MTDRLVDFSTAGSWRTRIMPKTLKKVISSELPQYLAAKPKKPFVRQLIEMASLYRYYKCLPIQYFRHGMYKNTFDGDIKNYLPHHYLYRFIAASNPLAERNIVSDKLQFELLMRSIDVPVPETQFLACGDREIRQVDGTLVDHETFLTTLRQSNESRFFVKPRLGVRALGAFPFWIDNGQLLYGEGNITERKAFMDAVLKEERFGDILIQNRIVQDPSLNEINPECINTMRIVTYTHEDKVSVDGCMLSIGPCLNGTDSWSNGAMIIRVDPETGQLAKYAHRKYSHGGQAFDRHPVTDYPFAEYRVPNWDLIREVLSKASLALRPLTSLGWDLVISDQGPVILETNDDWDCYFCQEGMMGLLDSETGKSALATMRPVGEPGLSENSNQSGTQAA
ncbi:MAG: sugar-transfer associated ATP-grasp domain-containing protein [Pseudomonadota bacterium]